jgi:histone H1/5
MPPTILFIGVPYLWSWASANMCSTFSRQGIKKYIKANNSLGSVSDATFNSHINRALAAGEKSGVFERPKGPSGPVKLKKPAAKPAAPKAASKPAAPKVFINPSASFIYLSLLSNNFSTEGCPQAKEASC